MLRNELTVVVSPSKFATSKRIEMEIAFSKKQNKTRDAKICQLLKHYFFMLSTINTSV